MGADGISRLINVTQMKSHNANEEAMAGADRQRDLINQQKDVRGTMRAVEAKLRDKTVTDGEYWEMKGLLEHHNLSTDGVDGSWSGMLGHYDKGHEGQVGHWKAGLGDDEQGKKNQKMADEIKARFQDSLKDLESADKLGSFEINDLMSNYNQAETLASSVRKKLDDTESGKINK